jgi:Fic family protein
MSKKDTIILPREVFSLFKKLIAKGRANDALEFIEAAMIYSLDGEMPDENSDVWLYDFKSTIENIDHAAATTRKNTFDWRTPSLNLSRTALMVYFLYQEEGEECLSPAHIEKLGLMARGTASKAIAELKERGYLGERV